MILALIVALGFIAGYYYGANYAAVDVELEPVPIPSDSGFFRFNGMTLDTTILRTSNFKDSTLFGTSPVDPGQVGVPNPFSD